MPENLMVRCLVCAELLSYDIESTEPLIEHLKQKHPYIHVAKVPVSGSAEELDNLDHDITIKEDVSCSELRNQHSERRIVRKNSSCPTFTGKFSPGKLFCPACRKLEVPIIRRQKKFSGNEGIPVCYMLGCWPLCFLPFFAQSNRMFEVYCKNCSFFIGRYDKKLNVMMSRPVTKPLMSRPKAFESSQSASTTR